MWYILKEATILKENDENISYYQFPLACSPAIFFVYSLLAIILREVEALYVAD